MKNKLEKAIGGRAMTIHKLKLNAAYYDDSARGIITEYKAANTCEWIKYDYRTMCPKNHGYVDKPYWRIPTDMKHLLYCPYCGKRIRLAVKDD